MFAYTFTERNVSIVLDGVPHVISRGTGTFPRIVEAIEAEDTDALRSLLNPKQNMEVFTEGRITFDGHALRFGGELLHNAISTRLMFLWENGLPFRSLLRFMDRLMENPSHRAVNELYGFLEATDLPITNDGHFLAYKKIRNDYKDIHTGTIDNSVGATPTVRRNEVDENPERTCSKGLHVCSRSYLPYFGTSSGNRIVIVKVDPVDVVAVPRDYNNAKMRVCRYEVVQEITDNYTPKRDSMPSYHTDEFSSLDEDDSFDDFMDDEDDSFDDFMDDEDEQESTPTRPKVSNNHVTSNKLNEHQVRDIKRMLDQGEHTLVEIGALYGVNESTIRKIRNGITWSWVK